GGPGCAYYRTRDTMGGILHSLPARAAVYWAALCGECRMGTFRMELGSAVLRDRAHARRDAQCLGVPTAGGGDRPYPGAHIHVRPPPASSGRAAPDERLQRDGAGLA